MFSDCYIYASFENDFDLMIVYKTVKLNQWIQISILITLKNLQKLKWTTIVKCHSICSWFWFFYFIHEEKIKLF
jgi:hypothetical protein